jgi:hypothetical protein
MEFKVGCLLLHVECRKDSSSVWCWSRYLNITSPTYHFPQHRLGILVAHLIHKLYNVRIAVEILTARICLGRHHLCNGSWRSTEMASGGPTSGELKRDSTFTRTMNGSSFAPSFRNKYNDADRVFADVDQTLIAVSSLSPKTEVYSKHY